MVVEEQHVSRGQENGLMLLGPLAGGGPHDLTKLRVDDGDRIQVAEGNEEVAFLEVWGSILEAAIQEEVARIDPVDFGLIAEETAQGIKVRLSPRDELAVMLQVFPPVPGVTFLATFGGKSKERLVDLIGFLRTQAPIRIF